MGPPRRPPGDDPAAAGPLSGRAAIALLEQAGELAAAGDYETAHAAYSRVVGHADPGIHVAALLGVAESRYRLDDEEGALQAWISATQAPDTPHTWRAWKALAAARVRQGDLRGAARSYREAERRAPADERPEIASRLGWLSKETGDEGAARRHFGRSRAAGASPPTVTYAILAVTIAIFVGTLLPGRGSDVWYQLLALDKSAVAEGEIYRLVTVVLVHGGILHVATNMYALYLAGPIVEGLYGKGVFLAVYLLAAAAASVASYILVANDSVGASGGIFGLFGLLAVAYRIHRPVLPRHARAVMSQLGMLIVFNLILGFGLAGAGFPLDNAAHVGGLLAGAWLGFVIPPRNVSTMGGMWQRRDAAADGNGRRGGDPTRLLRGAAVALLVAVIAGGLLYGTEVRRNGRRAFDADEPGIRAELTGVRPAGASDARLERGDGSRNGG